MYRTASSILKEIEQWRENSSTNDTLNSLTSIVTFLEEIKEIIFAILREEEEAATEFPCILRLLIKKIKIASNNSQIRQWWYDVITLRTQKRRETKRGNTRPRRGRVARGGLGEKHAPGDNRNIAEVLNLNKKPNCDPYVSRYRGYTVDTNGRIRQSPNKQMSRSRELPNKKQ